MARSCTGASRTWPSPAVYYQLIPNKLLQWGLAPACLIMAAVLLGLAFYRSRRSQQWQAAALPVAAAAVAMINHITGFRSGRDLQGWRVEGNHNPPVELVYGVSI